MRMGVPRPAEGSTINNAHNVFGVRETLVKERDPRPTVLVVDDEPAVLLVVAKVMRRMGYTVLEAPSAEEALQLVSGREDEVDVLVTDVVMPGMNGWELSQALRARHPQLGVLLMSGYTEDEMVLRGVRTDEVNFLAKPFSVSDLRERVEKILDEV